MRPAAGSPAVPHSAELRDALTDGRDAGEGPRPGPAHVSTEHLLAGLLGSPGPAAEALAAAGAFLDEIVGRVAPLGDAEAAPLPVPGDMPPLDLGGPAQEVDLARVLDASANRASEGLRVVEDYARFALDDPGLTRRLKEVRHRLAEAINGLDPELLLASRDVRGDVGAHVMAPSERVRENPQAVLAANFKRAAQALRSLEEYAKLVDVWARRPVRGLAVRRLHA